jgi:hypothetical protein
MDQKIVDSVIKIINQLDEDGLLGKLAGNCVLAAEIMQSMLYNEGIKSRIVECNLALTTKSLHGEPTLTLVGYDVGQVNNYIDTHVVVITETENPILIDISVGHLLGNPKDCIIAEVIDSEFSDSDIFSEAEHNKTTLVYRHKKRIKLPILHQKDLVTRLKEQHLIQKKINIGFWAILIVSIVTLINLILNSWILGLKLFF